MAVIEPQSAAEYDDRTTAAVKSVLIEIRQVLGDFCGKFVVVGGAVPWLLLIQADMPHIGTIDVDLGLDAAALGDGEYAQLVEVLKERGYEQRTDLRRFQLARTVRTVDGGDDIEVVVDFLMPRDAEISKNSPPLVSEFAVQGAHGIELALQFPTTVALEGNMPDGRRTRAHVAVASIPALLAMKGYAIHGRLENKAAYDIYYAVRNFPGGIDGLVEATRPLLREHSARKAYSFISEKFRDVDDFGPVTVRRFVEGTDALGSRTADQWQQDAFGQVDAWLRGIGLRST